MQWIPSWLALTYAKLAIAFGDSFFSTKDAAALTGLESKKLNLSVSRLASSGWLVRVKRGEYLALEPLSVLTALGKDWPSRLKDYPDGLVLVQVALNELVRTLGSRLVSVAVFGSLARMEWSGTSDVDLLVVADSMPGRYTERLKSVRRVFDACSSIRASQWTRTGREFHLLDIVLLTKEELDRPNQLFLLDLTKDAIVLYDKEDFLSRTLSELGRKLEEAGALRVSTPTGKAYWDLRSGTRGG
jgi:predicted nucleotidyltransferase